MKNIRYDILINKSSQQFGHRGFECILSVILVLGTIFLLMFVPIAGIALGIFASTFLCVGIKKYLIGIASNKFVPVEEIFSTFKISIKAFCLKVAYMLITFLWGIIFIIPGIVAALNYSLSSFIMAENPEMGSLECMARSKKMIDGYRTEVFIMYLSYFFVTIVSLCLFAALAIVIKNFTNLNVWVPMILMGFAFLFVLIIFIIPYFELVFANVYLEIKNKQIKKSKITTKNQQQANTKKVTRKKATV